MKPYLFILTFFVMSFKLFSQSNGKDTALILIDIQEFYFPEGKSALVEPVLAAENAKQILNYFRDNRLMVIHVRHNSEPGGKIHKLVEPLEYETIISKDDVNAYKDTELLKILQDRSIKTVVICGMQTHMCVEACVRASYDYGFNVILIEDACATKDLKYEDYMIKAKDVHFSTLATLKSYATIFDTKSFLEKINKSN
jgi:nicotinamidase-related amidase